MKTKRFKTILIFLFFILNLFLTNKVFAATLTLNPSENSLGIGQQFYIDLMLDPEGKSINAISGSISFPSDKVSFVRVENGKSMINLWVEEPKQVGGTISFAGVMTSGFAGVIDPFDLGHKLPGLITRLVFEAESHPGPVNFSTSIFPLYLSDGLGTEIDAPSAYSSINIGDFTDSSKYVNNSSGTPELEAYVTRDPNIFNDKYTLVFKAFDKETGIKSVMIKEGRRDWKEIESPYLLRDQSRHSMISLQAINFSGAGVSMNFNEIPYDWKPFARIASVIIIILILLLVLIIRRRYVNKRK